MARINFPFFDVVDFGAAGDDSSDDTEAIQLAFDTAAANSLAIDVPSGAGGYMGTEPVIYFRPGIYRISDEITLPPTCRIFAPSAAIIKQMDDSKRVFVGAAAYDLTVEGLKVFRGTRHLISATKMPTAPLGGSSTAISRRPPTGPSTPNRTSRPSMTPAPCW